MMSITGTIAPIRLSVYFNMRGVYFPSERGQGVAATGDQTPPAATPSIALLRTLGVPDDGAVEHLDVLDVCLGARDGSVVAKRLDDGDLIETLLTIPASRISETYS